MTAHHPFFNYPGNWIGEGRIVFSSSPEFIHYYTKWLVQPEDHKFITCKQVVELRGVQDTILNTFKFHEITNDSFELVLENEIIGMVKGKGIIDDKTVAWEFRGGQGLEGFEVCNLEENGDYMIHAEYSTSDGHRTTIDGRIWLKQG